MPRPLMHFVSVSPARYIATWNAQKEKSIENKPARKEATASSDPGQRLATMSTPQELPHPH